MAFFFGSCIRLHSEKCCASLFGSFSSCLLETIHLASTGLLLSPLFIPWVLFLEALRHDVRDTLQVDLLGDLLGLDLVLLVGDKDVARVALLPPVAVDPRVHGSLVLQAQKLAKGLLLRKKRRSKGGLQGYLVFRRCDT